MPRTTRSAIEARAAELEDAIDSLRAQLLRFKRAARSAATHVRNGGSAYETLTRVNASQIREEMNDALATFEEHRRKARAEFVALSREEGVSVIEISKRLGITRQLVHRLLLEAGGESESS